MKSDMSQSQAIDSKKSWKENLQSRKWGEHKHCIVCGRAIAMGQDFCSQPCKDKYGKAEKDKDKKGKWQIVFIFVIMIVFIVVLPMLS
jgi:predicted nucleic acid-binding Zn ribbon protein